MLPVNCRRTRIWWRTRIFTYKLCDCDLSAVLYFSETKKPHFFPFLHLSLPPLSQLKIHFFTALVDKSGWICVCDTVLLSHFHSFKSCWRTSEVEDLVGKGFLFYFLKQPLCSSWLWLPASLWYMLIEQDQLQCPVSKVSKHLHSWVLQHHCVFSPSFSAVLTSARFLPGASFNMKTLTRPILYWISLETGDSHHKPNLEGFFKVIY